MKFEITYTRNILPGSFKIQTLNFKLQTLDPKTLSHELIKNFNFQFVMQRYREPNFWYRKLAISY